MTSPEVKSTENAINQTKKELNTSINDLHVAFKQAKIENNRLLKKSNLELIQLIEQGDHVVKSPWSSWQMGANYFYSNSRGIYKGRGDKTEKYPYEGVFIRSNNLFERVTSPLSVNYKKLSQSTDPYSATTTPRKGLNSGYGIGSTTQAQEPILELKVDASIRPKSIELDPVPAPTVSILTPSLDPLNIPDMDPPSLNVPEPATPDFALDLPEPNTKPFADFLFDRGMVNSYGKTAHIDPDGYGAWKKFETSKHNIGSGDNKPSYVGDDTSILGRIQT